MRAHTHVHVHAYVIYVDMYVNILITKLLEVHWIFSSDGGLSN